MKIRYLFYFSFGAMLGASVLNAEAATASQVTAHYVVQAHQRYTDALQAAIRLHEATIDFVKAPSETTHYAAKEAWIEAHSIYSHTEVFRFGNPNVDDWEGRVNSWPIDEGFIDYVDSSYIANEGNPHALENLIGSNYRLTDELLEEAGSGTDPKKAVTQQFTDAESNVAAGFHAIEFLLWGQDLNEQPTSAGQRSYTDYLEGDACTNNHCKRRGLYLTLAARILRRDLLVIIRDWNPEKPILYSKIFSELTTEEQLHRMLLGMGSLSYGELAGERMQVALIASDQEDEQNCFSDTTHLAIYHNALSIETLYLGQHTLATGDIIQGPSLSALVAQLDPNLDAQLKAQMATTRQSAEAIVQASENGQPFDQLILPENQIGREKIQSLIDALLAQTESIEKIQKMIPALSQI